MTAMAGAALQALEFKGVPEAITRSVRLASERTGVDFSYLMAEAAAESSFNPRARSATSSAAGLYQFIDRTWLDMVRDHGHKYGLGRYGEALKNGTLSPQERQQALAYRDDHRLSAAMAAEFARSNKDRLEEKFDRDVGSTELYLAHFLGPSGAERFIGALEGNPNRRADLVFPEAARANAGVFYEKGRPRSLQQVFDFFAAKFPGAAPASPEAAERLIASEPLDDTAPDRAEEGDAALLAARALSPAAFDAPRFFAPPLGATGRIRISQEALLLLSLLDPPGLGESTL